MNSPSGICTVDGAERRRAGGNFPLIRIEHRATNFRVTRPESTALHSDLSGKSLALIGNASGHGAEFAGIAPRHFR